MDAEVEEEWLEKFKEGGSSEQVTLAGLGDGNRKTQMC
jgi:hypothetical protein